MKCRLRTENWLLDLVVGRSQETIRVVRMEKVEQKPDCKRGIGISEYRQLFSMSLTTKVQKNGSGSGGVSGVKRSFSVCVCMYGKMGVIVAYLLLKVALKREKIDV